MALSDGNYDGAMKQSNSPNDPETIYNKCGYCSHGWLFYRGKSIPCNCDLGDYWLHNAGVRWQNDRYKESEYEGLRSFARSAKARIDAANKDGFNLANEYNQNRRKVSIWQMVEKVAANMAVPYSKHATLSTAEDGL